MISIARKNLSSLLLSPNSFIRNSNVHFFPSIHFFSTSRIKRLIIPSPEICDVLVNKHQFSPDLASLASSRLQFRSPKRADSVLSFLKEYSFTTPQLEKMVLSNPRILGFTIEGFKFRFKVFHDLGLSSDEIAKMMSTSPSILHSSMSNRIIPSISMLKGLLGSNQEVARLLRKSYWFLTTDLKKTLMPNVEILKSCGITMDCILRCLYTLPRCFLIKPDLMRKSVDKAIALGFSQSSTLFIHAAVVFASMSEGMWEVKLRTIRDLGFSDDDIFTMFRKQPMVFSVSGKKMKNVIELRLLPESTISPVSSLVQQHLGAVLRRGFSRGYKFWESWKVGISLKSDLVFQELLHLQIIDFLTDSLGRIMMRLAKSTSQR